jgi:hypothetical protein
MKKVAQRETLESALSTRYHKADQIKKNEVDGACGTHGRVEKLEQDFGGNSRRKKSTWKTKA